MNNTNETALSSSEENTLDTIASLGQGYTNVNLLDSNEFLNSNETITEYLKNRIARCFPNKQIVFLEEKDEIRSTNYIKNLRQLKTFSVRDLSNVSYMFVFDVTGWGK